MPLDFTILKEFGTTNERLREIFTAKPEDLAIVKKKATGESKEQRKERLARARRITRDIEIRRKFEEELQSRLYEGMYRSLSNWRIYAAIDMAFDSSILTKMSIPLLMYAQGKINMERAVALLSETKSGQNYIKRERGKDGNERVYIDIPQFVETEVNLVRSIILRRWAAQKNKYSNLWPLYKYESRSTGLVGKCRADVMSQRAEIMADQFGHRSHDDQVVLDAMLYGFQFDFQRCAWECDYQYRRKDVSDPTSEIVPYVCREGIGFVNAHPTRTAWDISSPPSSINSDSGCEWCLFWDVQKFGDVWDNPHYFNKDKVGWTNRFFGGDSSLWRSFADYFNFYGYAMSPPPSNEVDVASMNDRVANIGFYSSTMRDSAVFVSNYYRKLVPKDWGIGEYPFPVWVRFVTASDSTVVYAEIMPSTPAAFLGINWRDSRLANISMAMDVLPYQQQITNLLTQLMKLCQAELFKVYGINVDVLEEQNQIDAIDKALKSENWSSNPVVVKYSLKKLEQLGMKPTGDGKLDPISISEARQSSSIQVVFEAMIKVVQMAERMMALSPNEQGQPAPREISATEVVEIANTTTSVYSSISNDIDEFRAAKKRMIYEATVSCSKADIECPVKDRYTPDTIRKAGFAPKEGEDEDVRYAARRTTVIGSPRMLVHDYIFTSRDGAERPVNTSAANTLVQLIGQTLSVPVIAQAMGKEKLYEMFNEVFRLSGAGIDLNLQLREGEDDTLGADQLAELSAVVQEMQALMQQMGQQVMKNAQDIASQDKVNAEQQEAINGLAQLADRLKRAVADIDDLKQRHEDLKKSLAQSISYKDAPPSIQMQMEMAAGYKPAPASERLRAAKAKAKAVA